MNIIHGSDGNDVLHDIGNSRSTFELRDGDDILIFRDFSVDLVRELRDGDDILIFRDFSVDLVRDFSPREDIIALDWSEYILPYIAPQSPPPDDVHVYKGGRGAVDEIGFAYNKNNGKVWFDLDGDGGYNAIEVCRMAPGLNVHDDNFMFV